MQHSLLPILRCPVTRQRLTLQVISEKGGPIAGGIEEGILFGGEQWCYPVIKGIPRLCIEAFLEEAEFLKLHLPDYATRRKLLLQNNSDLLHYVIKKNKRTRESFSLEWGVYDYDNDNTWNAGDEEMLDRFLAETGETRDSIIHHFVFDAGCGNGKLNCLLGQQGVANIAMDFSNSVELAYRHNQSPLVHFIQGDVQFPPVAFDFFSLVHCSGVLIHTNNTELSFSCLVPTVKVGGKLSVWLYHPRSSKLHRLFNAIRAVTSRLPLRFQYYLYLFTLFPVSYVIKKLKGSRQNKREMMVDILDWFTPQFRWEHGHAEVSTWYFKRAFSNVKITTNGVFGFNTIGTRNMEEVG